MIEHQSLNTPFRWFDHLDGGWVFARNGHIPPFKWIHWFKELCWHLFWLVDWLVGWLVGRLVDWLIGGWLVGWLVDWLVGWLIDWLIGWLVDWLIDWLIDWLVGWLIGWLIDWFIDWLMHWSNETLTSTHGNHPTVFVTSIRLPISHATSIPSNLLFK